MKNSMIVLMAIIIVLLLAVVVMLLVGVLLPPLETNNAPATVPTVDTATDETGETDEEQPTGHNGAVVPNAPHTHSYQEKIIVPTCLQSGYSLFVCSCGDQYTDHKVPAKGHGKTKTDQKESTCEAAGYEKIYCTECDVVISQTDIPQKQCSFTVTQLSEAAEKCFQKWGTNGEYMNYTDWHVQMCENCFRIDNNSIKFAYEGDYYNASVKMLTYVNDYRESAFGTDAYNLVVEPYIIRTATELCRDGAMGLDSYSEDCFACNGENLYTIFQQFCNSWQGQEELLDQEATKFGFGFEVADGKLYCAILTGF